MQYTIDEIAHILGVSPAGATTGGSISWLLTDSRSLCFPEGTLFFALKTERNDGHRYIGDLYRRGVRHFVVSRPAEDFPQCAGACFLQVGDTLDALQRLAAYHRSRFSIPVVAITGSNGKTTVKEWLHQLLSPDKNVCRSPRSYNSQIGVPLSLWLIDEHTDIAVIEAGISRPGEMERLERMIRPTVGVITNVGQAHQEQFLSYDIKCVEKLHLLCRCREAVVNLSDNCIARCVDILPGSVRRRPWVMGGNAPDDAVLLRVLGVDKSDKEAHVRYRLPDGEHTYAIPFTDEASVENSISCLAVCLTLGLSPEVVALRMAHLEPVAMRMEVRAGVNGCTFINDTYNSDVHSLGIALDFMARRMPTGTPRTLILSDILQSGEPPQVLYGHVAQMAAGRGITKVIGVGEGLWACASCFPMETRCFRTTDDLLDSRLLEELHDEFILLKGARPFRFERIADRLTLRVHQTILDVDLNALVDNLNHYRAFCREGTRFVCMVKANAYGMGAAEVSKTLQEHGVDYLAVAVADEGAELRRAGITTAIMVMNPETTALQMLFDYRLEPEVFSFDILEALIRAAEREGITHYPVHIKIDTGMHRLGFDPQADMDRLVQRLQQQRAITPASVFSHFVGSDGDGFDAFSHEQFALFTRAADRLQEVYSHRILRHICNSAAIEHFPQYHLDMVRLGIGLYGVNPRTNAALATVATLRTTILQIRDVPAGDSVGYSRRTTVDRPTRVAALPIGYADGLARALGNRRCYCLVGGKPAPYLGNICMDVCMVDVTDIPCQPGDTAIIFGEQLPVTTLSDAIGTIPYEVLTSVAHRVPHVYVQQ